MQTGLVLPGFPEAQPLGRFPVEMAMRAEALGFDYFSAGDHMFGHVGNPDPLAVLAACASVTERISLLTGVMITPLREPALLAKQAATIDTISGGRFVLGAGVGGEFAHEWEAMEVPLAGRGRRTDEYLAIIRALWSGEQVHFDGEFRTIHGVTGSPTPARSGGPPIWIGGRSDAAVQRAARHDGWYAYTMSPRSIAKKAAQLTELRPEGVTIAAHVFAYVGRTREAARAEANALISAMYQQDFTDLLDHICAVGTADEVAERLDAYRTAGVDVLVLCPPTGAAQIQDQVEQLASSIGGVEARHAAARGGR